MLSPEGNQSESLAKLKPSIAQIANVFPNALAKLFPYRIGYSGKRRKAGCLAVRYSDDGPSHRCQGVGASRVADAHGFALMFLIALVFDIQSSFLPTKIASKRAPACNCKRLFAGGDLLVHAGNAQIPSAVSFWQPEQQCKLRLPWRGGSIGNVLQAPLDFPAPS